MENVGQFIGEPAARGLVDEGLDGGDKGAITGKPNCIVGPQADVVEAGGFAEGIVTAAMGIAGEVIQELELSKDGEVGAGAESGFEFGQSSDFVAQEMLAESLGVEGEWAHNVIVPTDRALTIGTITQWNEAWRMRDHLSILKSEELGRLSGFKACCILAGLASGDLFNRRLRGSPGSPPRSRARRA
jgi:hypothetical protein